MTAPHVPAAFINALSEEGTKAECIEWLQKLWNENCELTATKSRNQSAQAAPDRERIAAALAEKWPGDYAFGDPPEGANQLAFETADIMIAALSRPQSLRDADASTHSSQDRA